MSDTLKPSSDTRCNLCGSDHTRPVLRSTKPNPFPHLVVYNSCDRCSFVSLDTDHQALDQATEALNVDPIDYDDYQAQEITETHSVMASLEAIDAVDPALVSILRDGRGKRWADVGCGAGGSLIAWRERGWDTSGVEPSMSGRFALERTGLAVQVQPYTANTFESGSLAMIYTYHAIEHFERPFEALANFARHLEPGGLLYIETSDVLDAERGQLGYDHWSLFSARTLGGALEAAGFDLLSSVDRSAFGTHGVAFLAKKRTTGFPDPVEFVPPSAIRWSKNSYCLLRLALWHAFNGGRGSDLGRVSAPLLVFRTLIKSVVPAGRLGRPLRIIDRALRRKPRA